MARLAGARAVTGGYLHANAGFDDELGRLRLLEARYDPGTFGQLCPCSARWPGSAAWRWAREPARWPAGWPPRPDPLARS